MKEVNIDDLYENRLTKKAIKTAVKKANTQEVKSEVLKTRKVEDRWEKDSEKRDYLGYMNLREARVWVRYRSRMTKGVKANRASAHRNDMNCRCCEEEKAETQEHI